MFRVVSFLLLTLLGYLTNASPSENDSFLRLLPGDSFIGKTTAPIKIVEYHAVTCPHCAYFDANILPQIKREYVEKGKVLYITREFPVDKQSFTASLMMLCMDKNKVGKFRSTLFATQKDWRGRKDYVDLFLSYAELGQIDTNTLRQCLDTQSPQHKALQQRIFQEKLDAYKALGAGGIPIFFVNGLRVEGAKPWKYWDNLLKETLIEHEYSKKTPTNKEPCPAIEKNDTATGNKVGLSKK